MTSWQCIWQFPVPDRDQFFGPHIKSRFLCCLLLDAEHESHRHRFSTYSRHVLYETGIFFSCCISGNLEQLTPLRCVLRSHFFVLRVDRKYSLREPTFSAAFHRRTLQELSAGPVLFLVFNMARSAET